MTPEQYAEMARAVSDKEREPGFLVVLGHKDELPSQENLKTLADGMDWDLYSTRQRLLARAPRVLRRETRKNEALRWVSWMSALDLAGFYIPEQDLFNQQVFEVLHYELGDGRLLCFGKGDKEIEVPLDAAVCSAFGEVTTKQVREQSHHDILMGDIKNTKEVLSVKSEVIFDVHIVAPATILRFRQSKLLYPKIFPGEQMASSTQIREIYRRITAAIPAAPAFNEFHRVAASLDQSWEILSRSTHLAYNPTTRGMTKFNVRRDTVSRQSDRAAFELYSILWRFQTLRG